MPLLARDNAQEWELPSEGLHDAVCCDVVDLGESETRWGKRHRVQLRWQLDEETSDGKPMLAMRTLGLSLAEKSTLRPLLEAWRGVRFNAAELKGFDLERLINAPCQVQIMYNVVDDGHTFANVHTVIPPARGRERLIVRYYIRVKDRTDETPIDPTPNDTEDIPF